MHPQRNDHQPYNPRTDKGVPWQLPVAALPAWHVVYDPISSSAILEAHKLTHGVRVLPHFQFDRAEVIVSFDADFLGTWIAPVEFTNRYRAGRQLTGSPPRSSYHVQVESCLSLSGSKADERIVITPDEIGPMLTRLAASLARKAWLKLEDEGWKIEDGKLAASEVSSSILHPPSSIFIEKLAERLWQAPGRSLVLCGSQDVPSQVVCNFINHLLGNYGKTLNIEQPSFQRQGSDKDLQELCGLIRDRKVAALFILDSNPVYDLPDGDALADDLKQITLVVSCTERLDETARVARYVCPHPHYLESWSDAETVSGCVAIRQPTIPPLRDSRTRSIIESLAAWRQTASVPGQANLVTQGLDAQGLAPSGVPVGPTVQACTAAKLEESATLELVPSAYDLIRKHWEANIFPRRKAQVVKFQDFWDRTVHDGHTELVSVSAKPIDAAATKVIVGEFVKASRRLVKESRPADESYALVLYSKVGMPDGSHAYNPWLQELPDPISMVTWDNYACLSPTVAAKMGLGERDVIRLEAGDKVLELPVFIQPGQHDRVVAVALGYGSIASARFAKIGPQWLEARPTLGENGLVGKNAAPLLEWADDTLRYTRVNVKVAKTGKKHTLASTQTHYSVTVPAHLAPPGQSADRSFRKPRWPDWRQAGFLPKPRASRTETCGPTITRISKVVGAWSSISTPAPVVAAA